MLNSPQAEADKAREAMARALVAKDKLRMEMKSRVHQMTVQKCALVSLHTGEQCLQALTSFSLRCILCLATATS